MSACASPETLPDSVLSTGARMASLDDVLRERFGLESFRPWQREAIEADPSLAEELA